MQNGLIPYVSKPRQAMILLWSDAHFYFVVFGRNSKV